jgi:hypothetical protein
MKKLSIALAVLIGTVSFAAAPPAGPGKWDPNAAGNGEWKERAEKRMRLMQVIGLAEALDLSETEALKLAEKMRTFDDKRRPLREEMMEAMKTLKSAASGDSAALPQVDVATQRILDGRARLAQVDKEMFNALAKDLSPQKRAQLALFLAEMHGGMKGMKMKAMKDEQGRFFKNKLDKRNF